MINITATIEDIAFPIFIGISNACGIMVGNRIGAGMKKPRTSTRSGSAPSPALRCWLV
ncbi:MAG: hypothetical protein MZU97_08320 [Bacillus subtilis]|nr:hypothetical protein [Bacillus subtilis]